MIRVCVTGSVEKDSGGGVGDKRGSSPLLLNNGKLLNTTHNSVINNNNNTPTAASINNQFKALGMRNNFLSGQQIPTSTAPSLPQQPPPSQPVQGRPPPAQREYSIHLLESP